MQPDARIIDVVHSLDDPIEYVRGVVGSFFLYGFDKQKAVVRVGISGKGIIPNYCIEQYGARRFTTLTTLQAADTEVSVATDIKLRHCFHGRNHKEILDDSFKGEKWSLASMSFTEVQTLLGHLRGKSTIKN